MRLIDADALIDELNNRIEEAIRWGVNAIADRDKEIIPRAEQAVATFCEASLTAKKMPTVEPNHGQWKTDIDTGAVMLRCSACGNRAFKYKYIAALGTEGLAYCPYCGAKMKGEKNGSSEE